MKVKESLEFIEMCLKEAENPVILSSFGKDSMVMLDLIRKVDKSIPVVHYRVPFQLKRNRFADWVIRKWGLVMYDYPPMYTDVIARGNFLDYVAYHSLGDDKNIYVALETINNPDSRLCMIRHLLDIPVTYGFQFPWDMIFMGNKNTDNDPVLGATKFTSPFVVQENLRIAYPIVEWSDEDVWAYTEQTGLPYNYRRYDRENGYEEFPDKNFNNNFIECCNMCINPAMPLKVHCFLKDEEIPNIAKKLPYEEERNRVRENMEFLEKES